MSPDDIFAAQFWPWPDPAIKRDAQGRVLFVNAAFLALYGGRVEDWRGNAVGGWPAPQSPTQSGHAPYRFETRMPAADGSEQVYDWMEQTLADGNAFALARNVTVFTQPAGPGPANVAAPQEAVQTHDMSQTSEASPAFEAALEPAQAQSVQQPHLDQMSAGTQAHDVSAPPALEANSIEDVQLDPASFTADLAAQTSDDAASAIKVPEIEIPNIEIPSDDAYVLTETNSDAPEPAPAADIAPSLDFADHQTPQTSEPEREFERRALPIEDDAAVLGNNWRDAVIAKAVGAEDVAPLPEAAEDPLASDPAPALATPTGGQDGIHILLAEDNAINALLTRTLLEAEGHKVDTVEDGALAVEAMKTTKYDLIFMDMRMPNMDGLEATRKIRALPNVGKTLPIIALTANAFDDDRNACFDSGMNDFMTKPVSAEELSEKVRDWTSEEAKSRMMQAA